MDTEAANEVRWGSHSALVAVMLHFPELKSELELLGSEGNVDLTDHEVDALWTRVREDLDSLVPYVPSSVACNPPDGAGE
jgi:hypothetical protein